MEIHEYAKIFPPMSEEEFNELVEDIRQNGQLEPIIVYEDKILDGRNRYNACMKLGIKPKMVDYNGENLTPLNFVISKNIKRRHLTASQKAILALEIKPLLEKEAKKRQLSGLKQFQEGTAVVPFVEQREKGRTIEQVGKIVGVGKEYVWQAEKVKEKAPDLAEKVMKGEMTLSKAFKEVKKKEVLENAKPLPEGKYFVVYADPPWQYNNSGFEQSAENHYPTMSTAEICNLPIQDLTADEAVLFLWATNPLLEDALKVCRAWGFEYKTNFVWVKSHHTGGFYCYGQHELLLIATKGSMLPQTETLFSSVINASNKEHSKKPDVVYEIIEAMYKGPYIELFARNKRENWDGWGAEYGIQ